MTRLLSGRVGSTGALRSHAELATRAWPSGSRRGGLAQRVATGLEGAVGALPELTNR